MDNRLLPIKLIMPEQGRERPVMARGRKKVPFRKVDDVYRERLSHQITAIRDSLPKQINDVGAMPARVSLIPEALAKTHRPEKLFSEQTCPIVGAGALGELFVKVTPDGLDELDRMVMNNSSDQMVKELSSVRRIESVTPNFRLRNVSAKRLLRRSPRGENGFIPYYS